VLDRLTGAVTTQVTFAGDGFQINGGAIGVVPSQLVKFVPTGMQIFPDPWTMTALGAFSLSAVKTLTFIASQAGVASEFSADVIVLGNHLRTSTAFFDNLNDPNHCSFNPQTTNTGAIGKSTNRWGQVWTGSLNVLQTAKTANYTIDSGTAHDFEIDVNTATVGAFAVTLPDPAVNAGRRLSIIDFGNNLTVANVTLTRHGAEKINGVAGNLALILSGARYEIACNGVDWWVTKSVLA
jgi:hypothetical protein